MTSTALFPGSTSARGQQLTLGVMGGGQLGRMFVHAAQAMGYFTAVLDPDTASPAGRVSHYHIQTAYDDEQGLAQLMQRCDAITTEFEKRARPCLADVGRTPPGGPSGQLRGCGTRPRERKGAVLWTWHVHTPTRRCFPASYAAITTPELLAAAPADLLPGILKNRSPGIRRQRPGARGQPRRTDRRLGRPGSSALRTGKADAAGGRMFGHRGRAVQTARA
jgi:5-(carboxyamino)imidazole ribonucleotide synthase